MKARQLPTVLQTMLSVLMLASLTAPIASAHMMVAQHGTLNFVDGNIFMILSLPMSAFSTIGDISIDDNSDGKISMIEFNKHRKPIVELIKNKVTLHQKSNALPLQGIMLSPVLSHENPKDSIVQLTVMGKFVRSSPSNALQFNASLYGTQPSEKTLEVTASIKAKNIKHTFKLSPEASGIELFSTP